MIRSLSRLEVPKLSRRLLALLAVVAAAAVAAACSSSPGTSSAAAAKKTHAAAVAAGLKTANVGGTSVLTNAKGFTLYSFAPDSAHKSVCNGACATAWPPVRPGGGVTVKGAFSTISRSSGGTQLTFRGHPLYTFAGDTAGQAKGNGVTAFGGLWHEATASGGAAPGGNTSPGSGGGGY